MQFSEDKDLVEIMNAVREIAVDIYSIYTYLSAGERSEKRPYLDHLIMSYVDKCRYKGNLLPDHLFFVQTIDSYLTNAFRDQNHFVSRTINGLMRKLTFEILDGYKTQLRKRYPVESFEHVA